MVGSTGFEPATSASRTQRSARLSYDPKKTELIPIPRIGLNGQVQFALPRRRFSFAMRTHEQNNFLFDFFALLWLPDEENAPTVREPAQAPVSTAETIALIEHEQLAGRGKSGDRSLAA